MVNRAVFLDRDGVINYSEVRDGKPYAPRVARDFILLPGVENAIVDIKSMGYQIIVVTNQPDINNKLVNPLEIEKMHRRIAHLPISKIYVCPHSQNEGCVCRKPRPGMLFKAREDFNIDLTKSFMLGDRQSDMEASKSAGCKSVFIDKNYKETKDVYYDMLCSDITDFSYMLRGLENC